MHAILYTIQLQKHSSHPLNHQLRYIPHESFDQQVLETAFTAPMSYLLLTPQCRTFPHITRFCLFTCY